MISVPQVHMALDDISFMLCRQEEGECSKPSDFMCHDGSCVPAERHCDANYDCYDKSDEYNCETNVVGNSSSHG